MKNTIVKYAIAAALVTSFGTPAMAQTAVTDPGHPRVNEVDQRLQNQQNRTDSGVQSGTINANQEARDQKTDAKVSQELSADEAKNGGHITKGEQTHMNHQLNRDSNRIKRQKEEPGSATAPVGQ